METHPRSTSSHFLIYLLLLIVGFGVASALFYLYPIKEKIVEKPVEVKKTVTLPSDAVQLSGCLPYMGEHWVKLADIPRGPYYTVDKGKVMGIEYMFRTKDIPGDVPAHMSQAQAQKYVKDNKLTFGDIMKLSVPDHNTLPPNVEVKAMDIEWSPPHAGLVEPHYDMHMYLVDKSELNNVCPNAGFENELPGNMSEELKKLGVPLP